MARCGCSGTTCGCRVTGGQGVDVRGSGSQADPYVISGAGASLIVQDSRTVDLNLGGLGSLTNPWVLTADADLGLGDLNDLDESGAQAGYVIARKADGTYHLQPAATTAPGAISVSDGLIGDGSAGAPITVRVAPGSGLSLGADGINFDQSAFTAQIASAIASVGNDLLLPAPVAVAPGTHKLTTSAINTSGSGSRIPNSQLTFRNNGKFKLLVRIDQEGWGMIKGDKYDKTASMYAEPEATGGTFVQAHQARGDSYNVPGGTVKNIRYYEDMNSWQMRVLEPGQSLTAYARCWVSPMSTSEFGGYAPEFRGATLSIIPLGWIQTPGAFPPEPPHTEDPHEFDAGT